MLKPLWLLTLVGTCSAEPIARPELAPLACREASVFAFTFESDSTCRSLAASSGALTDPAKLSADCALDAEPEWDGCHVVAHYTCSVDGGSIQVTESLTADDDGFTGQGSVWLYDEAGAYVCGDSFVERARHEPPPALDG